MSLISKIRSKPEKIRKRYAFGGAVIVTAIVVGVWGMSLSFKTTKSEPETPVEKTEKPFKQIFSSFKTAFSNPPKLKKNLKNLSSTDDGVENSDIDESNITIIDNSDGENIPNENAVISGENVIE
ncbi:MAG: hypothetical protein OEX08_01140 [Candidatus Nomurabacteria bacterium]|nr:hypothetical protein [Candidatus Nomurabacteria bacterium]